MWSGWSRPWGPSIMVFGGLVIFAIYVPRMLNPVRRPGAYEALRRQLGRCILLGLEVLIVADIVLTIIVEQTIESVVVLLRSRLAPRWLVMAGYATGLLLLVAVGFLPWVEPLFPAWVLALSMYVLSASFGRAREEGPSVVLG